MQDMPGRNDDRRDVRDDVRAQIREFLSTRRARINPEQAGLPDVWRRPSTGQGLAPRGGRRPGWDLAGVLRETRARHRHCRLGDHHRGRRAGAAAQRGRAGAPARPASHRRHHPRAASQALTAAGQTNGPTRAGLDDRHPRVRTQRTPRHPGRQRARGRALRAGVRPAGQATQHRQVRLPRPAVQRVLPGLGRGRQRHRRPAARRGRPQSLRPGTLRPDRGTLHAQRRPSGSGGPHTTFGSTPPG